VPEPIRKIAIVGGGTAGWMTAALLNRRLPPVRYQVTLVESEAIGTIGVGEATIPTLIQFLRQVGIAEDEFLRRSHGTYKLAIQFVDWRRGDDLYYHPFGPIGGTIDGILLYHHWRKARQEGRDPSPYASYAQQVRLVEDARGPRPYQGSSPLVENGTYAYHLDASLFAELLRDVSTRRGVEHVIDDVLRVELDERGRIDHLVTREHGPLRADLFVDCTGFAGHLIERALGSPWQDWTHVLLCDRALAVSLPRPALLDPYTRATALDAGWVWRIPLSHRIGSGYVYSSAFVSDDEAERTLLAHTGLDPARFEPRRIRMRIGHRARFWVGNCVAIGLAGGFIEPLESTGIYLIQKGAELLLDHLPDRDMNPRLARHYDAFMSSVYDEVRDFIVLHYVLSRREDSEFWRAYRHVTPPDSLRETLDLYERTGMVVWPHPWLFRDISFCAIAGGLEHLPEALLPRTHATDPEKAWQVLTEIKAENARLSATLPDHTEFIDRLHGRTVLAPGQSAVLAPPAR
jgi:tryptophan halogenase